MFLTKFGSMEVLGNIVYPISALILYEGFLMVLYSRLHLIINNVKILRALLFVILGIGIPLQIIMVLAGDRVLDTKVWVVTFRLEMIFPFSEIVLSSLYVWLFVRFLNQSSGGSRDVHMKRTLYLLVLAESFVVVADVVGITLWYMDLYLLRLVVLPFTSAAKLKVEFMILNRLTGIGKRRNELRDITVSTHGEEERGDPQLVITPCTFQSEAPTLRVEEKGLGIEVDMNEHGGVRGDKTPTDSIREIETSNEASRSEEQRDSLDEMERRYLGRISRSDGMA